MEKMKAKNKKTGEVREFEETDFKTDLTLLKYMGENSEWEVIEEPKQTDIESIIEEFIVECNTSKITDDGGNSFNKIFKYLKEKMILKLSDLEQSTREKTLEEVREKLEEEKKIIARINIKTKEDTDIFTGEIITIPLDHEATARLSRMATMSDIIKLVATQ